MNNNNELNEKVTAKLKELEGESNNTQKLVRLTVEQMRELLLEGNGETVYHKIVKNIMDSRKALQKEVNEKFKESEIERFKKLWKTGDYRMPLYSNTFYRIV